MRPKGNQVQENEKGKEVKTNFSHATPQFPDHALVHTYVNICTSKFKCPQEAQFINQVFCFFFSSWTAVSEGIMM